jgi:AcrR family transcriptional regulator
MAFATRRFAENGFHPTSVADIVDGVGVGKGVFYWYFPSKEDLLLEILRDALLDLRRTQQAALEPASDPLQRIEFGIRASLTWSAANRDILRLVMFARTEEAFDRALAKGRHIGNLDTARHVQDAIDAGTIAPGDPIMLAVAIRGITEELSREYLDGSAPPGSELCDTAVRMCVHGLLGVPPERRGRSGQLG